MRRAGPLLAAAIVVLTNLFILAGVARNRSGEPDALVTLTEREMPLGRPDKEDTGRSLRLQTAGMWRPGGTRGGNGESAPWFDQRKLEAIGFDCSVAPEDPQAEIFYRKALPRRTYAVLEQEGHAWDEWLAQEKARLDGMAAEVERGGRAQKGLESARGDFEKQKRSGSRLFIVDVGNDPEALRREHPDRSLFLILPAVVRLNHLRDTVPGTKQQAWVLLGRIEEILVDEVHLPLPLHSVFESIPSLPREGLLMSDGHYDDEPRYEVVLAVGRRHEPWVKEVRRIRDPGIEPAPGQRTERDKARLPR